MDGVDIKRVMKKIYLKLWSIPGKPGSGVTRLVETAGQNLRPSSSVPRSGSVPGEPRLVSQVVQQKTAEIFVLFSVP